MLSEEKKALLQKALKETEEREYVAWVNWQVVHAQVGALVKLIGSLEGS